MKTEKCYYCERLFGIAVYGTDVVLINTKDHVIPKSKGGNNTKTNLVSACKRCNTLKDSYLPDEFALFVKNVIDCYFIFDNWFRDFYPIHILERIIENSDELARKIEPIKSYCLKQIKAPIGFDVRPKRKLIKKPKIEIDTKLSSKILKSIPTPKKKKRAAYVNKKTVSLISDTNKEHTLICEYTWGGVPTDTVWAKNSPLYKETKNKLIDRGIIHRFTKFETPTTIPTFKTNELTHHEWLHRYNLEPEPNFHYED